MKRSFKNGMASIFALFIAALMMASIFAPITAAASPNYNGVVATANSHMTTPVEALTETNRLHVQENWMPRIPGLNGVPGHHTYRSTSMWSSILIWEFTVTSLLGIGGWPSRPGLFTGSYDSVTLNITANINAGALQLSAPTISSGQTLRVRSCPVAMANNNGQPFTITMGSLVRHFNVDSGGTLILENIILDTGGLFSGIPAFSNGGVRLQTPTIVGGGVSRLYLGEGAVIRNASASNGGAVQADGFGLLGGAHSVVTMLPGSLLENNVARDGGGGIWAGENSVVRIAGDIRNNNARDTIDMDVIAIGSQDSGLGGGIMSADGRVEIRGGVISGNEATIAGGGVFVEDNRSGVIPFVRPASIDRLFIYGGIIEHNVVHPFSGLPILHQPQMGYGGGVVVRNTNAHIRGGSINHNSAVFGAGVYARGAWSYSGGLADMIPGVGLRPSANVHLHGATARYSGTMIQDNTARMHIGAIAIGGRAGYGGGVRADAEGILHMHGGTIQNNHARRGGGVSTGDGNSVLGLDLNFLEFMENPGRFYMHGGSIEHNTADLDGGGVMITPGRGFMMFYGIASRFTMTGGRIYNNEAGVDGGGVWVRVNNQSYLGWNLTPAFDGTIIEPGLACVDNFANRQRPRIENNRAGRDGGGIYHATDTCIRLDRVDIVHNHAGRNGGGLWLATYQNHYFLGGSAYNLNGSGTSGLAMRPNVWFQGNTAGGGAYVPPVNAATFGTAALGDGPRMPLSANISIETGVSEHPHDPQGRAAAHHQLNNYDINHQGYGHVNCNCCCEFCCTEETRDPEHECEPCPCDVCACHACYVVVTFDPRNGTAEADFEQQEVIRRETAQRPTNPTRAGYYFDGWFTTPECECPGETSVCVPFNFDTPILDYKTLYARWTPVWRVTFDLNGGSYAGTTPLVQYVRDGGNATPTTSNPTRSNHIFLGWESVPAGSSLNNVTEDRVFVAQWQVQLQITFDLHGGQPDVEPQTILAGGVATRPENDPTREGYIFRGWYTAAQGGAPFVFGSPNYITSNTVVHARWDIQVTFNLQGGSYIGDFPPQTLVPGALATEPSSIPVRENFTFLGWFTSSTGDVLFDFAGGVYVSTVIYARWEADIPDPIYWVVSFDLQGGEPANGSYADFAAQTIIDGGVVTMPPHPVRSGYEFVGWYTSIDGGTAWLADTPVFEDRTLYARWVEVIPDPVYNVIFDLQGGINDGRFEPQQVYEGQAATNPGEPLRPGYQPNTYWVFNGWALSPNGQPDPSLIDSFPIYADTTFYAVWTPAAPIIYSVHADFPFIMGRGEPGATLAIIIPCDRRAEGQRTITVVVDSAGNWSYFAWSLSERVLVGGDLIVTNQTVNGRTSTDASTVVIGSAPSVILHEWYTWYGMTAEGHILGRANLQAGDIARVYVYIENTSSTVAQNISVRMTGLHWDSADYLYHFFGDIPPQTVVVKVFYVTVVEDVELSNIGRRQVTVIFG